MLAPNLLAYCFFLLQPQSFNLQNGTGDANDIWKVIIVNGRENDPVLTVTTKLLFVHYLQNCALTASGKQLPKWGFEQQEVSCNSNIRDKNAYWNVEDNVYSKCEYLYALFHIYFHLIIKQNEWFFFLHLLKLQIYIKIKTVAMIFFVQVYRSLKMYTPYNIRNYLSYSTLYNFIIICVIIYNLSIVYVQFVNSLCTIFLLYILPIMQKFY